MKRKKVFALLCVAAMSVTGVMPAMAADDVAPQETVAVESEIEPAEEQEEAVIDGWYVDGAGNTYYYQDGEMIKNLIVEIADNDGVIYGYYFDEDGIMLRNNLAWGTRQDGQSGYVYADEQGHLYKGWLDSSYYGEDYIKYYAQILEEAGKKYYIDIYGELAKNREIAVEGVIYYADENGVLTVKDTTALKSKWFYSEQAKKWYWLDENGKAVENKLLTIGGKQYYFNFEGEMQTGTFYASYPGEEGEWVQKTLYADADGAVDVIPGWKKQGENWYYVKSNGEAAIFEIVENINGAAYYFDYEGVMQTGRIEDEDNAITYVADSNGAIARNGWVKDCMDWYYADEKGEVYKNKWIDNTFYLTSDGVMVIGETTIDGKVYVFDENGYKKAVIGEKDGWQLVEGDWYYTRNGEPYNGWVDHTYYIRDGKMVTNSMVQPETDLDRWAYVGEDGAVKSGWILNDYVCWSYAEKSSITGDVVCVEDDWRQIGGEWYYFNGRNMYSNRIVEINGKLEQFTESGAWKGTVLETGWIKTPAGDWFYVNKDGTLNTESEKEIGGKKYYFDGSGQMKKSTRWYDRTTGESIWVNGNGERDFEQGWKKSETDGCWYYVEDGIRIREERRVIGNTEYWFDENGALYENVMCYDNLNDKYVLFDENGEKMEVSTGWYCLNSYVQGERVWYYFQNGLPVNGYFDGYYLEGGMLINYIYYNYRNHARYMFDENGHLFTNGWIYRWGFWYYAGSTGKLYTGEWMIDGVRYIFNNNGEWVR